MKLIELKCIDPYYSKVASLEKPFEVRKDDRNYQTGDVLHLRRYCSKDRRYSGVSLYRRVSYLLTADMLPDGLKPGYVAMGLVPVILADSGYMRYQGPGGVDWYTFARLIVGGQLVPA